MKRFFSFLMLVCICIIGSAQEQPGRFTIQPKVGINISDFTDDSEAKKKVGLAAGLEAEYQLTETFSFAGGVMYSMQGAKYKGRGHVNGHNTDLNVDLSYITVPLMVNAYLAKGFALKFGLQPGFEINCKAKSNYDRVSFSVDVDGINSFDFSIPVGLSYEFRNVVLDCRYNIGCTNVVKDEDGRNSVFQITLGYKFDI